MFSTEDRALMALNCGADLVIGIPVSFSCAPADRFAAGGAGVLEALNAVTHLAFGAENAENASLLYRAAQALAFEDERFKSELHAALETGLSYPAAQGRALFKCSGVPEEIVKKPNNTLAIAYMKRLLLSGSGIIPLPVRRLGSRTGSHSDGFLPSSALRQMISAGETKRLVDELPEGSLRVVRECLDGGRVCMPGALDQAVLARLYTMTGEQLSRCCGSREGLDRLLIKRLRESPRSVEELIAGVKTKRYTHTAISRCVMRALLGLAMAEPDKSPAYIRIIGFRSSAAPLLRHISQSALLPVISTPAAGREHLGQDALAEQIWSLSCCPSRSLWRQRPVII